MAAGIELRKLAIEVDLVEPDPGCCSHDTCVSLGGGAMRAFRHLGILDAVRESGAAWDGNGAIAYPVLIRIVSEAMRAAAVNVLRGCTLTAIRQDEQGITVDFGEGGRGRYDLVIAADGLYSKARDALFRDAPAPHYSGQVRWQAVVPRLPGVDSTVAVLEQQLRLELNPVSRESMCLSVTEDRPVNVRIAPEQFLPILQGLLARFSGPLIRHVHAKLDAQSQITCRPLQSLLVPNPWYRQRVVFIGDAVHAAMSHTVPDACLGVEDAIVLTAELAGAGSISQALDRYFARRWQRCRTVVRNSRRLSEIESAGGNNKEHERIMQETLSLLDEPF
jgi:2-polyprenyl-6-methoxyphenol hydroxylase-like FAD-dependent oxidoreductase